MPPAVQRKATVSSPGDPFERQADEVADKVMRMAEPASIGSTLTTIQRKCAACEDEENKTIQTARAPSAHGKAALDAEAAVDAAARGGEPLPQATRDFFEPRFGHDFSGVRVHADADAARGASAVNARAYAVGRDIVFGSGEYAPAKAEGMRLLAHELTHVVQQGQSAPRGGAAAAHPSFSAPSAIIQRLSEAEKADNLKSEKYAGNARLEAAYDNAPPLRLGEAGPAVRLVQEGLEEAGFPLPGSKNAAGELDGVFGHETRAAVRDFQGRFESADGLVGRITMGKLDDLAGGSPPVPPQPRQPPGTNAAQQVATANQARTSALSFAISQLIGLRQALIDGQDAASVRTSFAPVVAALQRWVKAKPEDADYRTSVEQTMGLLGQNLGARSGVEFPPGSDTLCGTPPCRIDGFGCTNSAGVNACQGFLASNLDCQRDVLLHEFNHFIGMHNERSDRSKVTKPADAFDNADSMAELVTELAGSPTDRCSSP